MSRFDPPPSPDQQALARIESAVSALVDSLQSLSALPAPQVSVAAPEIPAPQIDVTVPTEGVVDAVVRAVNEAVAALPKEAATPAPAGTSEAVLAEGSLTPLVEAAQQQRAVLEALQEKLSNLTGGSRSHFDGRLRNESGLIDADNPLPVSSGAAGGTELVYFSDSSDGTLPSGATVTIDPVLNTEPNVLDSGWISVAEYPGKNFVGVLADTSLKVFLMNATDDQGDNIFGDDTPTLVTNANFPAQLSARYADRYYRMVVCNDSGSPATAYRAFSVASPEDTEGITTAIDQPVFGFFPATVGRSVIMGRQPDGDYVNVPATGLAADVDGVSVETNTTLAAAGVYQSGWVDSDGWDEIELIVSADQVSATDGVQIDFTDDAGIASPVTRITRQFTYGADDVANGGLVVRIPPRLDGFRVTYTNGGQPQTDFFLSCTLRADATALPRTEVGAQLNATAEAITSKSVIAVRDDVTGVYQNVSGTEVDGEEALDVYSKGGEVGITPLSSWDGRQLTVNTTPQEVTGSTPLTGRKSILIKASQDNNRNIRFAPTSSVTSASARLRKGEAIELDLDETGRIWVATGSGTATMSIVEIA